MAPVAYSTAVAQSGGDLTPSALTKRGHGHHSHGHQGHRHSALGDAVVPAHSHAHGGLTATLPDARFKPRALTGAALDDIARRVRSQSDR